MSHYFYGLLTDFSHTVLSLVVSYCPVGGATCGESACFTQQNHRVTELLKIWLYSTNILTRWKHNSNWIKIVQITYFIQIKPCPCPINSFLLWYSIKGHGRSSHRFARTLNSYSQDGYINFSNVLLNIGSDDTGLFLFHSSLSSFVNTGIISLVVIVSGNVHAEKHLKLNTILQYIRDYICKTSHLSLSWLK